MTGNRMKARTRAIVLVLIAAAVLTMGATAAELLSQVTRPPHDRSAEERKLKRPPDRTAVWTDVSRVVAVGDLHGAYDEFVDILRGTGLVGPDLAWIGGTAHLVQMGDVLDRGPRARDIFDLLRRLETEAAAAGGRVHMLIGNHEAMALMGLSFDYRDFVTPEQFVAFVPERIRRRAETERRRRDGPGADLLKMWAETLPGSTGAQAAYFEFLRRNYGRWIAAHDTVIRIDDTVFVHGGLNDRYAAWPFERINRTVQDELLSFVGDMPRPTRVIFDNLGPLWYRDLALKPEEVMSKEIDAVLHAVGAKALVIAHTATGGSRTLEGLSRFGGRVWIIDTGIWDGIAGRVGALIIENGIFRVWGKDHD
jgi:hypothetical protein